MQCLNKVIGELVMEGSIEAVETVFSSSRTVYLENVRSDEATLVDDDCDEDAACVEYGKDETVCEDDVNDAICDNIVEVDNDMLWFAEVDRMS